MALPAFNLVVSNPSGVVVEPPPAPVLKPVVPPVPTPAPVKVRRKSGPKPRAPDEDRAADLSGMDGFNAVEMCKGIKWVFDNLGRARPKRAPSSGWKEYLTLLNAEPKLKAEFFLNVLPKFIPNKNELGKEAGRRDDGRRTVALIAKLQAGCEIPVVSGRAEDAAGESGVPQALH